MLLKCVKPDRRDNASGLDQVRPLSSEWLTNCCCPTRFPSASSWNTSQLTWMRPRWRLERPVSTAIQVLTVNDRQLFLSVTRCGTPNDRPSAARATTTAESQPRRVEVTTYVSLPSPALGTAQDASSQGPPLPSRSDERTRRCHDLPLSAVHA